MIKKHGTVTVSDKGALIEDFIFAYSNYEQSQEEALRWAIAQLKAEQVKLTRPPNRDADPSVSWLGWIPWVGW